MSKSSDSLKLKLEVIDMLMAEAKQELAAKQRERDVLIQERDLLKRACDNVEYAVKNGLPPREADTKRLQAELEAHHKVLKHTPQDVRQSRWKENMEATRLRRQERNKEDRLYIIATDDESLPEQKTRMINTSKLQYIRKILKESPVKTRVIWTTSTFLLGKGISAQYMRKSCYWSFTRKSRYPGPGWSTRTAGWINVPPHEVIDYIQRFCKNQDRKFAVWGMRRT